MSAYQPISLSPYLTRVLGSGGGCRLPVADRGGPGRRRPGTYNVFQLRVLGSPRLVDRQGRSILSVLAQPRRIALLAYLAIATEDGLEDRTRLVSLFWSEGDVRDGFTNLDRTLHALRRSLTRSSVRGDGNGRVGICRERVVTDLDELREALASADVERVAKLARGPLLGSVDLTHLGGFTAWLQEERARLEAAIAAVLSEPHAVRPSAPPPDAAGGGSRTADEIRGPHALSVAPHTVSRPGGFLRQLLRVS